MKARQRQNSRLHCTYGQHADSRNKSIALDCIEARRERRMVQVVDCETLWALRRGHRG